MRAYLAGPMRGRPDFNRAAFEAAAAGLRASGWEVVTPFDLDAPDGADEKEQLTADGPALQRRFARRDLGLVLSFRAEDGDAVWLLPEWRTSVGATAEAAVARWVGLRVEEVKVEATSSVRKEAA